MVFLLTGCPDGGGSGGVFEGTGSTSHVVYTANGGANTLSGFMIGTAGALTATTPATFSTGGTNSEWVAVSPMVSFCMPRTRIPQRSLASRSIRQQET